MNCCFNSLKYSNVARRIGFDYITRGGVNRREMRLLDGS